MSLDEVTKELSGLYDIQYSMLPTDEGFSAIQDRINYLETQYDLLREVMYTENNLYF